MPCKFARYQISLITPLVCNGKFCYTITFFMTPVLLLKKQIMYNLQKVEFRPPPLYFVPTSR